MIKIKSIKIFTEEMYNSLLYKSKALTKENNKLLYDLTIDDTIAVPEECEYPLTIPIAIMKEGRFTARLNRDSLLDEYFSGIEIALGTRVIKNKRIREIAIEIFKKGEIKNYDEIKEIVERNDYNIEKCIGQYDAFLDNYFLSIIKEIK